MKLRNLNPLDSVIFTDDGWQIGASSRADAERLVFDFEALRLKNQMSKIVARIEELRHENTEYDVACKICDEFDLWEFPGLDQDPDVDREVPSWLYYICDGMCNEDEEFE